MNFEDLKNKIFEKDTTSDNTDIEGAENAENAQTATEEDVTLAEVEDKYIRLVAEFDNFRKRTLKERLELIQTASEETITDILPVVDDLERAIGSMDEQTKQGIELIYQKLIKILSSKGVVAIDVTGEPFNEDTSEAVARIPAEKDKSGVVVDVVEKGYRMYDKIIRYAKVVVGE
ncbi:MAG: nucleotide exchange factor GrpE [Bacteroidales bacterium]|jgi:molecular chaperone GrpE|nr:nucleotide exchange factor GrpE [Bacteroidales bacterium]